MSHTKVKMHDFTNFTSSHHAITLKGRKYLSAASKPLSTMESVCYWY